MIRIADKEEIAFLETTGISYNIYFVGCSIRCSDCHNPQLWDPQSGKEVSVQTVVKDIEKNLELIDNVCILGGEPTDQLEGLIELLLALQHLPVGIWVYTGREIHHPSVQAIYELCDFIKCGKYDHRLTKQNNDSKNSIVKIGLASGNQYFINGGRINAD